MSGWFLIIARARELAVAFEQIWDRDVYQERIAAESGLLEETLGGR